MWGTKKNKSLDLLTFEFPVDVSKAFKNVSKHKRVLSPVIHWEIILYVNGERLSEDKVEVFVVEEFFNSLIQEGKFPMYTCSCGIFECGGFYVDVLYRKETVIWNIEQFSMKTFIFSKDNILLFAEKLIEKLADLNHLLQENGSQTFHDIDMYRGQLKNFSN